MRVWLDRERMAAQGLTAQDIEDALERQNLDSPGGRIESDAREFTVLAETDLKSAEQFNNMIIREVGGYPIRLRDIGYAAPGPYENRKIVRINGNEALGLGVVKQSVGNTLAIAEAVRATIPRLQNGLPEGMQMKVAVDTSEFISAAINAVYKVMLEALILVVLVIFIFLRSWRATIIPAVTIPVSLIGAFFFLPEWTRRWRDIFERELGFAGGLGVEGMLREVHDRFIYLDTGVVPVPQDTLDEITRELGLPMSVLATGLSRLEESIADALEEIGAG